MEGQWTHRSAEDPGDVPDPTEFTVTLGTVDDRLRALVGRSMRQVLDGSANGQTMEDAHSGRRGGLGSAAGVDALPRALWAQGMDAAVSPRIEGLYLDAMRGA